MPLSKAIERVKKDTWILKGSLDNVGETGVAVELHNMKEWKLKELYYQNGCM